MLLITPLIVDLIQLVGYCSGDRKSAEGWTLTASIYLITH